MDIDGDFGLNAGCLLLLVNNYASDPRRDFIPLTALGILLLIIAALIAYAGEYLVFSLACGCIGILS